MSHFDYKEVRRAEAHRKLTREQQRRHLLDSAVENAWLADQCIRLALAIFEDGIDVKPIACEILEECNLRDEELDLHATPKKIDRDKIQRVLLGRDVGNVKTHEERVRDGLKAVESGQLRSIAAAGGRVAGRIAVESGQLRKASKKSGQLAKETGQLAKAAAMAYQKPCHGRRGDKRAGGIAAAHKVHHVKRGIINPKCPLCCPAQVKAAGAAAGK